VEMKGFASASSARLFCCRRDVDDTICACVSDGHDKYSTMALGLDDATYVRASDDNDKYSTLTGLDDSLHARASSDDNDKNSSAPGLDADGPWTPARATSFLAILRNHRTVSRGGGGPTTTCGAGGAFWGGVKNLGCERRAGGRGAAATGGGSGGGGAGLGGRGRGAMGVVESLDGVVGVLESPLKKRRRKKRVGAVDPLAIVLTGVEAEGRGCIGSGLSGVSGRSIGSGSIGSGSVGSGSTGGGRVRVCAHCGGSETPTWRRGGGGEMLCNACGI
jgi:hypothetical protein